MDGMFEADGKMRQRYGDQYDSKRDWMRMKRFFDDHDDRQERGSKGRILVAVIMTALVTALIFTCIGFCIIRRKFRRSLAMAEAQN